MVGDIANNTDFGFVFALVAVVLGVVVLVSSRLSNVLAWGMIAGGLAGVIVWWPQ